MPVTIKDIAKQTQVSHSTVSRALHGSPLIAKNTAERIRQTAHGIGLPPQRCCPQPENQPVAGLGGHSQQRGGSIL